LEGNCGKRRGRVTKQNEKGLKGHANLNEGIGKGPEPKIDAVLCRGERRWNATKERSVGVGGGVSGTNGEIE